MRADKKLTDLMNFYQFFHATICQKEFLTILFDICNLYIEFYEIFSLKTSQCRHFIVIFAVKLIEI